MLDPVLRATARAFCTILRVLGVGGVHKGLGRKRGIDTGQDLGDVHARGDQQPLAGSEGGEPVSAEPPKAAHERPQVATRWVVSPIPRIRTVPAGPSAPRAVPVLRNGGVALHRSGPSACTGDFTWAGDQWFGQRDVVDAQQLDQTIGCGGIVDDVHSINLTVTRKLYRSGPHRSRTRQGACTATRCSAEDRRVLQASSREISATGRPPPSRGTRIPRSRVPLW